MRKASKHVQPYPPELRAEAIRLARTSGKPHAELRSLTYTKHSLRIKGRGEKLPFPPMRPN